MLHFVELSPQPPLSVTLTELIPGPGTAGGRRGNVGMPGRTNPGMPGQLSGTVAEKIHKALDTPISVEFKQVPLADVLKDLQAKVPDFRYQSLYELAPKAL